MPEFIEFIKKYDFFTIFSLGVFMWYLINQLRKSLGLQIGTIEHKIDSLDKDVRAMNTRISHLEGTVYGKDVYKHVDNPKE